MTQQPNYAQLARERRERNAQCEKVARDAFFATTRDGIGVPGGVELYVRFSEGSYASPYERFLLTWRYEVSPTKVYSDGLDVEVIGTSPVEDRLREGAERLAAQAIVTVVQLTEKDEPRERPFLVILHYSTGCAGEGFANIWLVRAASAEAACEKAHAEHSRRFTNPLRDYHAYDADELTAEGRLWSLYT